MADFLVEERLLVRGESSPDPFWIRGWLVDFNFSQESIDRLEIDEKRRITVDEDGREGDGPLVFRTKSAGADVKLFSVQVCVSARLPDGARQAQLARRRVVQYEVQDFDVALAPKR
ncbi:hypothetical protein E4U41_003239 [Claviceps citrina]|nr:hypothetical protein E4U41_003239 [Claviceps citrina]